MAIDDETCAEYRPRLMQSLREVRIFSSRGDDAADYYMWHQKEQPGLHLPATNDLDRISATLKALYGELSADALKEIIGMGAASHSSPRGNLLRSDTGLK